MKRIRWAFSALFLFAGLALQAAPVPKDRALDIARQVFAAQPATKAAGEVKFLWDGEDIATKSTVQPAFYVFTRDGGGFVIVAGDDNVTPILAISDHNEFKVEGMPENVKWWMARMKAYVRAAKTQTPDIRDQWLKFTSTKAGAAITGEVTGKVEHPTPEWDQVDTLQGRLIYNAFCPWDKAHPARRSITGCVATAISEVLTTMSGLYAAMPASASNGPVQPYVAFDGFTSAADGAPYPLGETYKWAELRKLMKRSDINQAITDGKDDVIENLARLMADMGAIMHASYSCQETQAITGDAPDSLMKYMGFNKRSYFDHAYNHSEETWRDMLKAELKDRPIIYTGQSSAGGHAFVFDGYGKYDGKDVFHVNFGWSGYANGYYYETKLETPSYDFSDNCAATFGFYPDPTSTYEYNLVIEDDGFTYFGDAPEKKGDEPMISLDDLLNKGKTAYPGKVKIVAEDVSGNEKQVIEEQSFKNNPISAGSAKGFLIETTIDYDFALGDRIACYYTTNEPGDSDVWVKAEAMTKNGSTLDELPLMPVPFIKTAASYEEGDWFVLALRNVDHTYNLTTWTITQPDKTVLHKTMNDEKIQLTQTGIYRIEATYIIRSMGEDIVKEVIVTYIEVN